MPVNRVRGTAEQITSERDKNYLTQKSPILNLESEICILRRRRELSRTIPSLAMLKACREPVERPVVSIAQPRL